MGSGAARAQVIPVPRRVRALLFDVDGTLYHQRRLRLCMAAELAAAPVAGRSPGEAVRLVRVLRTYRAVHEEIRLEAARGGGLADAQIRRTATRAGVPESEVRAIVAEWMCRRPLKYLRWCRRWGLVTLLSRCREQGTLLGVLSDYPAGDKLQALGVGAFFSQVLCTTDREIDALKPNPQGFWHACRMWSLLPEEVLYVGDRSDVDARGAVAAGVRCAVLTRRFSSHRARGEPGGIAISRLDDLYALVGD